MRSIYKPQLAWHTAGMRAESEIDSQPLSAHCVDYLKLFPPRLHSTSPLTHVKIQQKHEAGRSCQIVVERIMVLFSSNDSAFLKTHLRPHITISKSIVGLTHFCVNASQRRGKGVHVKVGHWEDWWIALRQTDHYERAVDHKQMT